MVRTPGAVHARFSRSFPAVPESVPRVRRVVALLAQSAGVEGEQLAAIRLAVSEAVGNVVRHAYPAASGLVRVTAAVTDGELTLLIADDGCGFSRPSSHPGLGFGLGLIGDAADEFGISEREHGGTDARIGFRIAPLAAAAATCEIPQASSAPACEALAGGALAGGALSGGALAGGALARLSAAG